MDNDLGLVTTKYTKGISGPAFVSFVSFVVNL